VTVLVGTGWSHAVTASSACLHGLGNLTIVPCLDTEAEHCQKGRNINITKKNAEIVLEASKDVGAQVDAERTVLFSCFVIITKDEFITEE
jgi:hypothetical protein